MKSAQPMYCVTMLIRTTNRIKNRAATIKYIVARGLNGQSDLPRGNHRPMMIKNIITMKNIMNIQFTIFIKIPSLN